MSHHPQALSARLASGLDAEAFAHARTLEERIDLVYAAVGQRLYSHVLAEVWADWLNGHAADLDGAQKVRLVKEMLLLSPNHGEAEALCAAILKGREPLQPADTPVFMVISCEKYLDKALRLRQGLLSQGAVAWIVTGSTEVDAPIWHEHGCVVQAPDTYEALSLKVLKGVEAIVERYGACPVIKIDDDCELTANFSVAHFREEAVRHDYVGMACRDPMHDRLWHHGKTSLPVGVYARRFHGPWASGPCYLLSARAAAMVARESVMFPGEFAVEHYEDKAMGDFMRRQGVQLHVLPSYAGWGIAVDFSERPLAQKTAVTTASAPANNAKPQSSEESSTQQGADLPSTRQRIPKVLHMIWVGDDSKRPDNCIQTWIDHNPGWTIKVWGNADLQQTEWVNARHMRAMWDRELNGVGDLMRWEILYNEGGIVVDADSICVRPLDDWLLEADAIACWENEINRPRLIACGMVGAIPENPFIGQIIQDIHAEESVINDMAWKTVGPLRLTVSYFKYQYTGLTILPSHFFIPDHFSGVHYEGGGIVYAKQEWASTHQAYDTLHLKKFA